MSVTVNPSRHSTVRRPAHAPRKVVVPDRTIRQAKAVSPIINLQSVSPSTQVIAGYESNKPRRQPISSTKVHTHTQKIERKKIRRPAIKRAPLPVAQAMESLLERHNDLPRHLARTAGRAHLLSQALNLENQKVRWYQRFRGRLAAE